MMQESMRPILLSQGQVIALRTPRDVHENFYLCVVDKVIKASEDTFNSYRHFILKDMEYIICKYLKKNKRNQRAKIAKLC